MAKKFNLKATERFRTKAETSKWPWRCSRWEWGGSRSGGGGTTRGRRGRRRWPWRRGRRGKRICQRRRSWACHPGRPEKKGIARGWHFLSPRFRLGTIGKAMRGLSRNFYFFVANDFRELLSLRGEEFVLFGKIWTFWQELTRRNGTRLGKMTSFVLPGEEQLWLLPR